nr:MAG TPA: hypothetical protein [Caudoviricetes sp.]
MGGGKGNRSQSMRIFCVLIGSFIFLLKTAKNCRFL